MSREKLSTDARHQVEKEAVNRVKRSRWVGRALVTLATTGGLYSGFGPGSSTPNAEVSIMGALVAVSAMGLERNQAQRTTLSIVAGYQRQVMGQFAETTAAANNVIHIFSKTKVPDWGAFDRVKFPGFLYSLDRADAKLSLASGIALTAGGASCGLAWSDRAQELVRYPLEIFGATLLVGGATLLGRMELNTIESIKSVQDQLNLIDAALHSGSVDTNS